MKNKEFKPDESFRDSIATINKQGERAWIFAKKPKGKFTNRRTYFSIAYLLAFFIVPFIKIHGEPLFLFNVVERKFIVFGGVFWPQDLFLFAIAMVTFIVFIVLFTVVFGRIFCGWVCPQTIFMDMVFRKIEYWIEGDAGKQKKLDKQPWNAEKIQKKTFKVIIFYLVSFIFANVFLSYIIGMDDIRKMIFEPISQNLSALVSLSLFTFVFFLIYLRFREQVCIVVCPYGRLQGVFLDKNSIVVAYDYIRGEPRAKHSKIKDTTKGGCVDCRQCVNVCPTGIDIRNGTQLECINCTACIDACDHVHRALGEKKGLIGYDSENGIANKEKLKITPRIIAYSVVLVLLLVVLVTLLATRKDLETTVFRTPGFLYQEQPNNRISNLFNIKVINKTRDFKTVTLKMETEGAELKMIGNDPIKLEKENVVNGEFFIYIDRDKIKLRKTKLLIGVYTNGEKITSVSTNFLGPISR